MGRRSIARHVGIAGALLLAVGGVLVGTALSASASTATITLTPGPTTGYDTTHAVTVNGSGFAGKAFVYVYECSLASGQPTIMDKTVGLALPVSCTPPATDHLKTTKSGDFTVPYNIFITAGVTGPPTAGTDSAGNSAATDAASYPCPQYASQSGGCAIFAVDSKGVQASPVPFTFNSSVPIPTTSTTTTQPVGCTPQPASATAGGATLTIDPGTCLTGGMTVKVTGSGFHHSSIGGATQCNDATPQPTMSVEGQTVPVSCSNPLSNLLTTSGTGTVSGSIKVVAGVVGPPAAGNDSAGNPGAEDAAKFPCPADEATGAGCSIAYGDLAGDQVSVPVTFAFNVTTTTSPPTTTTTTPTSPGGGTSSTTTTVPAATKGGSGTGGSGSGGSGSGGSGSLTGTSTGTGSQALAFTGPGTGLRWMGIGGVVLLILGGMMLALADQPRFLLRKLSRQGVHSRR